MGTSRSSALLPRTLTLSNAFPNPARGAVSFALDLPHRAHVAWAVFGVDGRRMWSDVFDQPAGRTRLVWQPPAGAGSPAPGTYLVEVRVEATRLIRRFVRL
jgi:hypothetical protein